jgi:serine/threonine protein kinase
MPIDIFNNLLHDEKLLNYQNLEFIYINKGSEGSVYSVEKCALKVYTKSIAERGIVGRRELDVMILCKKLVDDNVTIHVLNMIDFAIIHGHLVILMELVDGSLDDWVLEQHNDQEWYKMIFQIMYGIMCLQECLKMYHSDLKPKNILFKKLKKAITLKIIISDILNITFETSTIFYIADFGHAQSLLFKSNEISNDAIKLAIINNADLEHLIGLNRKLIVRTIDNNYSTNELIDFGKHNKQMMEYVESNLQRLKKIQKRMKLAEFKFQFLVKMGIINYIIDHKIINTDNIQKNKQKHFNLYFPSDAISIALSNLGIKEHIVNLIKQVEKHINQSTNTTDITQCLKLSS